MYLLYISPLELHTLMTLLFYVTSFKPIKKISFGYAANRKTGIWKSQRLISSPPYTV
jgi:hypothetical protein